MVQRKWILKDGVVLRPYGVNSYVDNNNLTDEMAELFLSKGKAKKEDFKQVKVETKKQKTNGNSK